VSRAQSVLTAQESPVLVISNRPLPAPGDAGLHFELLFKNSQVCPHAEENYFVYRLSR
jgi:hypothetical protein